METGARHARALVSGRLAHRPCRDCLEARRDEVRAAVRHLPRARRAGSLARRRTSDPLVRGVLLTGISSQLSAISHQLSAASWQLSVIGRAPRDEWVADKPVAGADSR